MEVFEKIRFFPVFFFKSKLCAGISVDLEVIIKMAHKEEVTLDNVLRLSGEEDK